jgi:septum formation protein
MERIILASASPRRAQLLRQLGLDFEVITSGVAEEDCEKDPTRLAKRLALSKARAVAQRVENGVVIGADTVVCINGELLGKPWDEAEAASMLRRLSGHQHHVMTGVAVIRQPEGRTLCHVEKTAVFFRPVREEEIQWYLDSGEPYDKAGGYGIQGKAAVFVDKLEGCYFNVVGLPLAALYRLLEETGVRIWEGADKHDNTAPDHQGSATK